MDLGDIILEWYLPIYLLFSIVLIGDLIYKSIKEKKLTKNSFMTLVYSANIALAIAVDRMSDVCISFAETGSIFHLLLIWILPTSLIVIGLIKIEVLRKRGML